VTRKVEKNREPDIKISKKQRATMMNGGGILREYTVTMAHDENCLVANSSEWGGGDEGETQFL